MSKLVKAVLLLTAVPLAMAGSCCLNWTNLVVFRVTASANGRIFAVVVSQGYGGRRELREWTRDLAEERVFVTEPSIHLVSSADGAGLVLSHYHRLEKIETATGQVDASFDHSDLGGGPVALVNDGEYIATLGAFDWQKDATQLCILRPSDGDVTVRTVPGAVVMKSSGDRLAYCNDRGELVVLKVTDGELRESVRNMEVVCFGLGSNGTIAVINQRQELVNIDEQGDERVVPLPRRSRHLVDIERRGELLVLIDRVGNVDRADWSTGKRQRVVKYGKPPAEVPYAVGQDFIVSAATPEQIAVTDLRTGETRFRNVQEKQRGEMGRVLVAFGTAFMFWTLLLLWDGRASPHRWRTWTDALLVIVLMHVIWLGSRPLYVDFRTRAFGFTMFLVAIWGVAGSVVATNAVLNSRSERV